MRSNYGIQEGRGSTYALSSACPARHTFFEVCLSQRFAQNVTERELDADIGAMSSVRKEALPCRAHLVPLRDRIRVTTSLLMQIK